ncbi:hypothetical protein H0H93_010184 [Arthromyces matolae]|nr:hypothetical protein H0H93_010184 [Arthromyces matolae]
MHFIDKIDISSSHSRKRSLESNPPTSLSSVHIANAVQRSDDDGATLMFSKMNISTLSVAAIEELASIGRRQNEDQGHLKRIAFGNNHLTALPPEFALLSQLRYVNLKRNNFSVFPDVVRPFLKLMPSLDTLDISHNRIKELPTLPGQLIHLRVFSLSKNKLTRLPLYLSQFSNLEVLEVERNPIEWPPKSVMEKAQSVDSRSAMKDWVSSLQKWLQADNHVPNRDDTGYADPQDIDTSIEENLKSWKLSLREQHFDGFTPHSRSLSVDSNFSLSSASDSNHSPRIPSSLRRELDRPPPLHLGMLGSFSAEPSPTRTLESYLPSPADSEFFDVPPPSDTDHHPHQPPHARNASYGNGLTFSVQHLKLEGKKSMPELRVTKLNFAKKTMASNLALGKLQDTSNNHDVPTTNLPHQQESVTSSPISRRVGDKIAPQEFRQKSPIRPTSSMTSQRNSYFQRLSTLPNSTFTLPQPLVCLIESARSILFAMCQVYQTLEHFAAHAVDDRISSVLRKVLDPAAADMSQLINTLERFDATSRKSLPSPTICRELLESCRSTVAVFGKAVGVLALQLQVIVSGDDVRYSRWILLELYGATAEVASAWEMIGPHIDAIKPFLQSKHKPFTSHPPPLNLSGIDNFASPTDPSSSSSLRPHLGLIGGPRVNGGARMARRHAGSFSSKDVEIGKSLPSYDDPPGSSGGVISGIAKTTPTPRAPKRHVTIPITTISSPSPTNPGLAANPTLPPVSSALGDLPLPRPLLRDFQSSASASSSASSSPSVASRPNFLDLPSNSQSQVDKEALQAVKAAVKIAPAVWDMIENLFEEEEELSMKSPGVQETIEKARMVTSRLAHMLHAMQDYDGVVDGKEFRDDAHTFLKPGILDTSDKHGKINQLNRGIRDSPTCILLHTDDGKTLYTHYQW